jgi:hypothetical protein
MLKTGLMSVTDDAFLWRPSIWRGKKHVNERNRDNQRINPNESAFEMNMSCGKTRSKNSLVSNRRRGNSYEIRITSTVGTTTEKLDMSNYSVTVLSEHNEIAFNASYTFILNIVPWVCIIALQKHNNASVGRKLNNFGLSWQRTFKC